MFQLAPLFLVKEKYTVGIFFSFFIILFNLPCDLFWFLFEVESRYAAPN